VPNRKLAGFAIFALIIIQIGTVASHWGDVQARRPDFAALYSAAKFFRHSAPSPEAVEQSKRPVVESEAKSRVDDTEREGMKADLLHPPFEILLFLPLSFLPYLTAYFVWLLCNIVMLWMVPLLLWQELGLLQREFHFIAIVYGSMFPVLVCLVQGQDAILLLLLLTLCYRAMKDDREFLAGILLALTLFKFQITIPIALLFLVSRKWKVVNGFACGAATIGIASLALIGVRAAIQYVSIVTSVGLQEPGKSIDDPALMPNLRGLVLSSMRGAFPGQSLTILVVVLSAIVLGLAMKWAISNEDVSLDVKFGFFVAISAVVSYHFFPHNACVVLLPLLLVAKEVGNESLSKYWRGLLSVAALGIYLAPNLLPLRIAMPVMAAMILLLSGLLLAYRDDSAKRTTL